MIFWNSKMKHKILVVDDNPELLRLTTLTLKNAGYSVESADSVKKAIVLADDFKPDLILSDVVMPEFDGYDLLRSVRDQKIHDDIFFVFISSKIFSPADQAAGIKLGADGFLQRPTDPKDLVTRVNSFITHRQIIINLKARNNKLLTILEENTDSILIVNQEGIIEYANAPSVKLFRKSHEEIIGANLGYPVIKESITEIELLNKGDIIGTAELSANVIQWNDKPAFLCTVRDVSERKKQLQKINKLNQLYNYLSMVNTRLLKINRIDEIFNTAAQIAVEHGTFTGVKFCKIDTEFMSITKLGMSVSDKIDEEVAEQLFEPYISETLILDRLMTTMEPIVYNNLKDKNLIIHNIHSFAIIPFNFKDGYFYTVTYFSDEYNFFDAQELDLLKEVTDDLEIVSQKITTATERDILIARQQSQINILMSISDAVIETDLNFVIKFWNKGAESIYQWSTEEVTGRDIRNLLRSEFINSAREEIVNKVFSEGFARYDLYHYRKDNKKIFIEANTMAERDISGNIIGYVTVTRDVTKVKIDAEKMRVEKETLKRIFDHIPIMLTRFDPASQLLFLNKEFERKIGWTNEDLASINLMEEVYPDPEYRKEAADYMMKAKLEWKEFRVRTKWGDYLSSVWSNVKLLDGTMIGIGIDLTDKKLMEQQLIEARQKAEEMARLKASFLANMSHEVRTPMIGILGYSELLNEEIEDEELRGMAASIHKSATRLLETLNLILDLSKIEAEKMTIVNRKIDLKELTSDVIESFLISAKNKGLSLELISETDDLVIHSDDRIIGQILNNLINNAIKFTFNGGIRLHLSKKIKNGFDYAVIKCSDTGIGIPEDKQFFIWDEFRQVSEGIGRNFEGTGLGLTLTKKFVAKIDGDISVESEVNKGTTFTVVIPFGKFDPALKEFMEQISLDQVQAPNDEKNSSKNVPYILYVEDDEIAYEIVSNYIKGLGELDWAQDAESAIQKIVQKNYDLILMDINLRKGLDGVQLTQVIRSQKNYTNTPVIAVTAYAMKGDREIFIEQGLTDYISKPFVKSDLVEIVKKYLTS